MRSYIWEEGSSLLILQTATACHKDTLTRCAKSNASQLGLLSLSIIGQAFVGDLKSSKKKLLNASQVSSLQTNDHFQLNTKLCLVYLSIIATYQPTYLPNGVSLYPRQWQPGTYILSTYYLGQVIQFQIVFQGQIYHYARHDVAPEWF